MLNLPISVLPEWKSPRVNMQIEGETLPVLLDTGAEISAMPKKIMEKFVDCSTPVSYTHLTLPTIYSV